MNVFKELFYLIKKHRRLKYVDKECDKYFKLEKDLNKQRIYVNFLIKSFEKDYGENLRKPLN